MKKIIIALLTVVMIVCCFTLVACDDKAEQETLKNYIFEQNGTVVTEDFILPSKIGGKDVEWKSDKAEVAIEKRAEDYLAKVTYPDSGEVEVKLTVTLGKASKDFTVRVKALDVYDFMDSYKFLKDKATIVADFDLDKTWEVSGKTANITWTVDTEYELYIAINEAGDKCLVTPASNPTPVRIKATFEYNGETASKSYSMSVYKEMTSMELVDYWYTNTGVSIDMSGYVVLIGTEYSSKYKNVTLYMVNDDFTAGYYLFRVKTDDENGTKLQPGVHITVTGTTNTDYNGLIETNAGGNLVVDDDIPAINVNEHVKAIDELVLGNLPETVYHESRLVSLTNWKVKAVEKPDAIEAGANFTILTITKGGVDVNVRISKYLEGAYKPNADDPTWKALTGIRETYAAGSTINVTGIFTKYGKNWQIMPLDLSGISDGATPDPDDKADYVGNKVATAIAAVKDAIKSEGLGARITAQKEANLPTVNGEVAISYAICGSSKAIVIDGGKFIVTPGNPENTTIMATYKLGDFETISFFHVESLIPNAATMVEDLVVADKIDKVTDLPTIADATISWKVTSGSESLAIVDNQLVPTLTEEDVTTILSVELTYKGETRTKDFIVIVKAGKGAVASPAPFEADKEYVLAVKQGNLDITLYGIGKMDGHYMEATDNPDDAKKFKVEVVDGKYKIYIENKDAKKYIGYEIADNGKGKMQAYLAMVDTDAPAWEWDADHSCFKTEITVSEKKEYYYFGTYNKFKTFSLSNFSYIEGSFPAFLGTVQFVPLTPNEITVDEASSENATVTLNQTSGLNGQRFTFSVAAKDGFELVSVKVNGATVEAVDGVYTGVVKGATKVKVETKAIGAEDPNKPEHAGTLEDPYTCADVTKIFATLDENAKYSKDGTPVKVYIKGYVTVAGSPVADKGYQSKFYIADEKGAAKDASVLVFSANFTEAVKSVSMNDLVVVYGFIMDYNGTKEVSYADINGKRDFAQLVSSVAAEKTDADKVAEVLAALTVAKTNFVENGEMVLPTSSNTDVTLAWTSSSEQAVVAADNTKVTFTVTDTTVVATLTVTATCNDASDTKTFDITLGEIAPQVVTVAQALELPDDTKITVTGVVTTVDYKWSDSKKNMSVTITDAAGGNLYIYKLATKVDIGDTITVTGLMGTYSNKRQIAEGATATIDAPHVCSEWTEADCLNAPKCTLCGKVKEGATALGHIDENADKVCDRCSTDLSVSYTDEAMDIFATTGTLAADSSTITWTSTNFTVVSTKNASNPIRVTDTDHFRVYEGAKLDITATNDKQIGKIVITCKSAEYATALSASLTTTGVTASVADNVVTITVNSGTVESVSFTATAQTRITNVTISYVA